MCGTVCYVIQMCYNVDFYLKPGKFKIQIAYFVWSLQLFIQEFVHTIKKKKS